MVKQEDIKMKLAFKIAIFAVGIPLSIFVIITKLL
jgi:hypothetical protein